MAKPEIISTAESFKRDFENLMAQCAMMQVRYGFQYAPQVVFHPEYRRHVLEVCSRQELVNDNCYKFRGVKFDFGMFENQQVVFRRM